MNLVLLRNERKINLSNEIPDAVNVEVLAALRDAITGNDVYIHLDLSNNPFDEECISMIGAIVKSAVFLQSLEMRNCGITDKMFNMQLLDALLNLNTISSLDLSKNKTLTDAAAPSLRHLIEHGNLKRLLLTGTSLTEEGGAVIVDAMQNNSQLLECSLPFTVGFKNLAKLGSLLGRNAQLKERAETSVARREQMQEMMGSPSQKQSSAGQGRSREPSIVTRQMGTAEVEKHRLAHYYTQHGRKNAVDSGPPAQRSNLIRNSNTVSQLPSLSLSQGGLKNSRTGTSRQWRDNVEGPTLASLSMLDRPKGASRKA
ncbi:hypothetical protein AGDE_13250 [Angomonas deanei]|nr:hypothetical protein AGDE_13250 [Angomonas deanei]|eukprot:EPY22534.1 hypothetical protein AGDE_13250 [Angomonas deanei]